MKVLLVTEVFPPRLGGDGIHVMELALHLQRLGVDVSVLTKASEGTITLPFEVKRVGLRRNDLFGRLSFIACALFERSSIKKADVIHAHAAVGGVIGLFYKFFYKKPVAVTVHTIWGESLSSTRVAGVGRLLRWFEKTIFTSGFDYYITVTKEIASALSKWGVNNVDFIPNGVNTEKFKPPENKTALRKKMGFGNEKILLFVGRLVKQKNVGLLLDSFKIFNSRDPDSRLLIAGSGPEEADLRKKANELGLGDNVVFLGSVDYARLPAYYQVSDCLVLTSLWEGLPLCALEATATGIPIVGTSVGGLPEVIRDGKNGFIIKKTGSPGVAVTIERVLKLYPNKVKKASRDIIEGYDWKTIAIKVRGIYSKVTV